MEVVRPFAINSNETSGTTRQISLIEQARELKKNKPIPKIENEEERKMKEEKEIFAVMKGSALDTVRKKAIGTVYTEPMRTNWRPPRRYRFLSEFDREKILQKFHILVEGIDPPPPIKSFKDMRIPPKILHIISNRGIKKPTPIQIQGLPVVLSGRDMIGIAFTGSGKSLVFELPSIFLALEEERKMSIIRGEGPFALIIVPSHELAIQTYESLCRYAKELSKCGHPHLKIMLSIGGMEMKDQLSAIRNGVHIIVGTPGRLSDMLNKKKFNLSLCKLLTMDEADRLLDVAFEEEIRNILDHFESQRQTLLFSATMPRKIQEFVKSALIKPMIINIGRAGAANLDVKQEVEYVKQEAKLVYLLEVLKKTAPPVLIFCENKNDVDDIHEYLMLKGVAATGLHGGKVQEERTKAITEFRNAKKDILVATDVAAKGLDFPDIKHVINYDLSKDIESYVHRIGRTGRCGKTGLATTFINMTQDQNILLDLKHLLMEAKQKLPPFLKTLKSPEDVTGECSFCGGLGHRMANCNKLESQRMKALTAGIANNKELVTQGNRYFGAGYGGEV